MSDAKKLHPDEDVLLQFADGELADAAMEDVRRHVAQCVDCRGWLGEIESGVTEYRQSLMPEWKAAAVPPPKAWFEIRERMESLERPVAARPPHRLLSVGALYERPGGHRPPLQSARFPLPWAAAAAAMLVAVIGLYWISVQPLSAAQLLRDAVQREAADERVGVSIRITTRTQSIVRPASLQTRQQSPAASDLARTLQKRFEEANYSWNDPLSAQSFSVWRAKLPDARDNVVQHRGADGIGSYEIRTRTDVGPLAEASLRLRASDLRAIEGTLRFRDNEVVDISEASADSPAVVASPAPPPGAAPSQPAAPADETVTIGDELRVRIALRRIDADLGEPIEVQRDDSANAIVVTALGLGPERRRILEEALNGLPKVQLRFREPQPVREAGRQLPDNAGAVPPATVQTDDQSNRTFATDFVNSTLEASESLLLRTHAIRELAVRFAPEIEAKLSVDERALLDSLLTNHYTGIESASTRVLEHARQISTRKAQLKPVPSRAWQDHAQSLVTAANNVDQILSRLLAGGTGTASPQLTTELDDALNRFENELAAAAPAFRSPR